MLKHIYSMKQFDIMTKVDMLLFCQFGVKWTSTHISKLSQDSEKKKTVLGCSAQTNQL